MWGVVGCVGCGGVCSVLRECSALCEHSSLWDCNGKKHEGHEGVTNSTHGAEKVLW